MHCNNRIAASTSVTRNKVIGLQLRLLDGGHCGKHRLQRAVRSERAIRIITRAKEKSCQTSIYDPHQFNPIQFNSIQPNQSIIQTYQASKVMVSLQAEGAERIRYYCRYMT